jgi:hypothetical protein
MGSPEVRFGVYFIIGEKEKARRGDWTKKAGSQHVSARVSANAKEIGTDPIFLADTFSRKMGSVPNFQT